MHSGFSEAAGIAKITHEHMVVEFEIKDALGVVKSAPMIALVPVTDIIALKFKRGVFHDSIEVQTNSIDNVASIPNSSQGKFKLWTKKRDRSLAINLMRQTHRVTGLPLPDELSEIKESLQQQRKEALQERLKPFCIAILVMVFIDLLFFGALFSVLAFGTVETIEPIQDTLKAMGGRELGRGDLILRITTGPMIWAGFGVILWLLLRRQRPIFLVAPLLLLVALPVHPGVIIGFPLAIWLGAILLNPANLKSYRSRSHEA